MNDIEELLDFISGDSQDDPRFKYNVGDIVVVKRTAGGSKEGVIASIVRRRNGYPEPFFSGYWFPLLFLEHIDGSPGGGEIHEDCVRLAGEDEIQSIAGNYRIK